MKAIVLAAGYATRLYPLTEKQPKALLPIGGKAILGYIMEKLDVLPECEEILIISNHKYIRHFTEWLGQWAGRLPVALLDDGSEDVTDSLGAIGDIVHTIRARGIDEDVLIVAGDNFFDFPLDGFLLACREKGRDGVCAGRVTDKNRLRQMGVVSLDQRGDILHIEEKPALPRSDLALYAIYYYTRATLRLFDLYAREGNVMDAPGHFLVWLRRQKPILAYLFEGECHDVGTPESYGALRERFDRSATENEVKS
ncbi:MAG: nucleotidyltransferase family protein [Peptococcaceae bacterium]|jgi:glucose-1-phosphate thymidylyltransferase|nr:nucleotidyltransferase family protein [Peptococcaceae bacterium]